MRPEVEEQVRRLPDGPGIYVFRDRGGKALYVGKAKSLKKRVASYKRRADDLRLATMVEEAAAIEFVETGSEAEALLLENNWIKNHKPRFNVLLRDDKTYPYVKLTLRDGYPRVTFTRRVFNDGAEYYGPFLPGGLARRAIKLTQKLFGIRVCTIEIDGSLPRPCLYYDMKRCLGPCVDGLTSEGEYGRAVDDARLFLNGRTTELTRRLKVEMQEASDALEYERAARIRDTLAEIESVTQRRSLSSLRGEDVDIYGVYLAGGNAAVTILVMRGGRVLDRRELFWERRPDLTTERLLSELLPQVYDRTTFIPKEIHLPEAIDGDDALIEWLSERKGERVYLRLPVRGAKAQRLAVAKRNAELAHRRRFRADSGVERAGASLTKQLALVEAPTRIEGIDISNLQGTEMVGSLVVWEAGRILKKDYRSFNLRNMAGQDDFAAIHQVVMRRYRRVLEEVGSMPDLILIDGGRGQLNAALEALAELGVEETPIVGLAKRDEEIYLPATPEPLRLKRNDPGLQLLQRIRDEAHRFAVDRHRRRRSKRALTSRLDDLPGVGSHRRKLLLKRFGSLDGVRRASLPELQELVGPILGQRIYVTLKAAETDSATGAGDVA
jgi:excinuclease ABC subunit C